MKNTVVHENVSACADCGEVKPLMRSGLCSECMWLRHISKDRRDTAPVSDRSAVSYSVGVGVPEIEAKLAVQAETTEKLSDIVSGLADTVKSFAPGSEPAPVEKDPVSLVNGLLFLVGAVVVIVVIFLALIKKPAPVAAVRTPAPVNTGVYL